MHRVENVTQVSTSCTLAVTGAKLVHSFTVPDSWQVKYG